MSLLAVIGPCQVTQGAVQGVPISGAITAHLTDQVTSLSSLAMGAAQSEPSGLPADVVPG